MKKEIVILLQLFLFVGGEFRTDKVILSYQAGIPLKEIGRIPDEFFSRGNDFRFRRFGLAKLLFNLRHFAVEARLVPGRGGRRVCGTGVMIDEGQMGLLQLLDANPARGVGRRDACAQRKCDCTYHEAARGFGFPDFYSAINCR